MKFLDYQSYFQAILQSAQPVAPYDNPAYLNYAKLNWNRQQRWLKVGEMDAVLQTFLESVDKPQQWLVITEPWCGDAAHILPFVYKLSQFNPIITLDIQLRDSEPFLIDHYLTGSSKSIPKLIVRNAEGEDLFVWGPRPAACQILYNQLKAADASGEEIKLQLQQWYNLDKGRSFQRELLARLSANKSAGTIDPFKTGI